MTDNEIIKALEEAIEYGCGHYVEIELSTIKDVLDLINRLQEELNQYAEEHHNLMAKIEKKDKDIEKWQQVNFDLCTAGGKLLHERKTIRAEAYKEFAERVKEAFFDSNSYYDTQYKRRIDNLLKELVGE